MVYCRVPKERSKTVVNVILQLDVAVFHVVGVDGAEALQSGCGEADAGRATDVLHLLHQADAPLEHAAETTNRNSLSEVQRAQPGGPKWC